MRPACEVTEYSLKQIHESVQELNKDRSVRIYGGNRVEKVSLISPNTWIA